MIAARKRRRGISKASGPRAGAAAGRPTKLSDPDIRARVLRAVERGARWTDAARAAGISARTIGRWLTRGRQDAGGRYSRFQRDVRAARAACRNQLLGVIVDASQRDWKAAAWLVERLAWKRLRPEMKQLVHTQVEAEKVILFQDLKEKLPHDAFVAFLNLIVGTKIESEAFAAVLAKMNGAHAPTSPPQS